MLPKNRPPTHPGEMLKEEFLIPMELSQRELAIHLGWTYARVNEIVNGRRGVSADSALCFAEALGTTPEFWLNLQQQYDLWYEMQHHQPVGRIAS